MIYYKFLIYCAVLNAFVKSNPCDITAGFHISSYIQFRQDAKAGTQLFVLPFIGDKMHIKEITVQSKEFGTDLINEYFRLDFKTLILNKDYDLDKLKIDFIELVFTCTASLTSFSKTFLLYIIVNDINNYAPEFVDLPYEFEIKELTPVGAVAFKKIRAIDNDLPNKPNSQISYSIVPGAFSEYFEFPLSTQSELVVAKLIHYDDFQKCKLTIKAEDHGVPPKSTVTTIDIKIIDVDDKDPIFAHSIYSGSITHNSYPGTYLNMTEEIFAYDQDKGINTMLRYSIDSNPGNLFDINPADGKIFLKNRIPKGFKNGFSLIIKATQIDNPMRSTLATVNINVINVNDNLPVFDSQIYEASIREDSFYNTPVITVHAEDADDNPIEYFMITNHDNPFIIESKTGNIKLNRKLDYETQNSYTIEVGAKDGKHTSTTLVRINVINVVDKAPYFEQVYYNFKIKSPNDVLIGHVQAVDPEHTGQIKYSLDFINNNDANLFCISKIGDIYVCPQKTSQVYAVESNLEKIDEQTKFLSGNIFDRYEYSFFAQASIPTNDTSDELVSKVECRVQIEYKILSESTSLSIGRELFKDPNTFYAFLAAIAGITLVMVTSVIIMIWYKCQRIKRKVPGLYSATTTTSTKSGDNLSTIISSESSGSNNTSCNASYRSGSKCIKKSNKTSINTINMNSQIINQWDEKGINSIFYGTGDTNLSIQRENLPINSNMETIESNNEITNATTDDTDNRMKLGLIENLKSFDSSSVKQKTPSSGRASRVLDRRSESDRDSKSKPIYSLKRKKSNKSVSRSLSSASTTSIPMTTASSYTSHNYATRTPSFSSMGLSVAVDNTISEESYPKEPLTINYETNLETSIQQQDQIDLNQQQKLEPSTQSMYKTELIVPHINYSISPATLSPNNTHSTYHIDPNNLYQTNNYDPNYTYDSNVSVDVDQASERSGYRQQPITIKINNPDDESYNKYEFNERLDNLAANNCDQYQYMYYREQYVVCGNNIYNDYKRRAFL